MADEEKKKPVPTWAYDKDGNGKLFADVSEVPKGWSDTPAKAKPAPKAKDNDQAEGSE